MNRAISQLRSSQLIWNSFTNSQEIMANLDFENIIKNLPQEIDPEVEKEPSIRKWFRESLLGALFHPENFDKISQTNISSITIENFKCIGDAVTIPIRPITLLFGKNSAGKSTVLQAIDYFNKIWAARLDKIRGRSSGVEMSGGYTIDFGDFRSLVHRHELDRKIRIRVEFVHGLLCALNDMDTDDSQDQIRYWMEVVTGCREEYPNNLESWLLGISVNGEELVHLSCKLEETPDGTVDGSNGEKLIRIKKEEVLSEDIPLEIYENTDTKQDRGRILINFFINVLKKMLFEPQEVENLGFDFRHLGPFRELPKTPDTSWEKGLAAWDALSKDPEVVEKTNHYIKNVLNLGYSIHSPKPHSTDLWQRPFLHDENNDIDVRPSEIGVGIAQVIPVVVGALCDSHIPRIFAVEQPELHVHPAVQVALGDVFIDSIKSSDVSTIGDKDKVLSMQENSKRELLDRIKNIDEPAIDIGMIKDRDPQDIVVFLDDMIKDKDPLDVRFRNLFKIKEEYDRNIQAAIKVAIKEFIQEILEKIEDTNHTMIIETHSEHLLLRLLRRVRETTEGERTDHTLTPDDLSVIYVRPTPEGVKFTPISVTDDGDFNAPWPEGFFDERVRELF